MNVELGLRLEPAKVENGSGTGAQGLKSRRMVRLRLHAFLILLDMLCIYASFAFARLVYPPFGSQWSVIGTTIAIVYLGSAASAGAYSADITTTPETGVKRALRALVLAAATVLFVAFYFKSSQELSRLAFAIGIVASAVSLAGTRTFFLRRAFSILGGSPYSIVLIAEEAPRHLNGEFSGFLKLSDFDPESSSPIMYDKLGTALRGADRVVLDCAPDLRLAWANALQGANIHAEIIVPELSDMRPRGLGRFGAVPTIIVAQGPLGLFDRLVKRLFDLAVAGTALIFLAPLFMIVAIAIKIESAGPVFFIQSRIGRSNRIIRVFKFRSMRNEVCDGDGVASTRRDDDRITTVGRFIRMVSIDELPQLINVLLGSMSIVGPRPHALGSRAEGQLFWEIDGRYWHRHAAKPGLTGLAQVRGYRGATNVRSDLTDRLHADLEYLGGWSIWRDLKIIALTFRVLVHSNAY